MEEEKNVRNLVLSVCDLKQHGDIPAARVGAQIVTVGTQLYLHGGADEKAAYGDLHVMKIETTQWKELTVGGFSKPTPRYGHSLTAWNDSLVLFGGLAADGDQQLLMDQRIPNAFSAPPFMGAQKQWAHQGKPSADLYVLQTEGLIWQRPDAGDSMDAQAPAARAFHSASQANGKLLVFGGALDAACQQLSNELWVLDLNTTTWSKPAQSGDVPGPRYGHKTCFVPKLNSLLLFGGPNDDGSVYKLDVSSYAWSRLEIGNTPPLTRTFHSMDLIGERVFIFAGMTVADTSDLYILDLPKGKWSRPLYEGQINIRAHASTVLHDKLIVFGGARERTTQSPPAAGEPGKPAAPAAPKQVVTNTADALGGEEGSQRISKKLFFLNVLEIKDSQSDGDFRFKLVTVGDSGVGKSCLLTRFVQDVYKDFHVSTIGVDFKTVVTMVKGKLVKLQLWDTAGQERFGVVTGNYYRNADGFVFVYDATNRDSFEHVNNWLAQVQEHHDLGPNTIKLLIGNKTDLRDQQQVTDEEGQALADKMGAVYVNTSAKTATNVDAAFLMTANKLVDLRRKAVQSKPLQLGGQPGAGASASGFGSNTQQASSGAQAGGNQGGRINLNNRPGAAAGPAASTGGGCGGGGCGGGFGGQPRVTARPNEGGPGESERLTGR